MEHGAGEMVAFYEAWMGREEHIVADLTDALPARRQDVLAPLVDAVMDHVSDYYEHKARLADRDVVAAFDPRWLNPLQRTFLWAWEWKPAKVFRFLDGAVVGSSHAHAHQQRRALEHLRAATVEAELEVDREVAPVQESLASPGVLAALRRQHPRNGEADEAVAVVGRSLRPMRSVSAQCGNIVGTLAPDQAGAFLAAMMRFHLGVHRAGRNWGSGNGGRRGL
uniref:1-like protein n=1 Tax=Oryza coarctata TaxID=77588 RepID=A0A6C0M8X0_ORYCO|nr:Dog 1-like protein [Oryza coarctata]